MNTLVQTVRSGQCHQLAILAMSSLLFACASVPKEAVELSYLVGQDLVELKQSYDRLLHTHFEHLRSRRMDYFERVWKPAFIADWIADGRLVDVASGRVVYDEVADDFVPPTPGREQQQLLKTVGEWSEAAIAEIEDKRLSLIGDLDAQEQTVRREAAAAFDRLISANGYVTAHLSSITEVQALQDEALERLGVKDSIDSINDTLVQVSNQAQEGLEAIRRADGLVDETASSIRDTINRIN